MTWVLVVALLAVAVFLGALAFWWLRRELNRIRAEVTRHKIDLSKEITLARSELGGATKQLEASLEDCQEDAKKLARRIDNLRSWAGTHFEVADAEAACVARRVKELGLYAVGSLEDRADAASTPRILRGGLYGQQPPILDLAPGLVDKLLVALQAGVMYRPSAGADRSIFYVRWPADAPPPEPTFRALLTAAIDQDDTATGAPQLRAVLHALRGAGPAVLRIGPLVLERTSDEMKAAVAGWTGSDDGQEPADADIGPGLITKIDPGQVIDLTNWPLRPTVRSRRGA